MKFRYILAASLLAAASVVPGAFAQEAQAPNPAAQIPASDKQDIQNFNLTDDVFNRIVKVTQEAKQAGIKPNEAHIDQSKVHSIDDLAKQITSSDPRIAPLIQKNGFTPRDFLIANLALTNAAIASEAKNNPQMAQYVDQSKVNQKNVAFYESHKAQINALMTQDQGSPQ